MSDLDSFLATLTGTLAAAQTELPGLHAWCVTRRTLASRQTLLLGQPGNDLAAYQDRTVAETTYTWQVYARQDHPAVMGTSVATVDPLRPLPAQLAATLAAARLGRNPVWELPPPPGIAYPEVLTADPAILADPGAEQARLLAR